MPITYSKEEIKQFLKEQGFDVSDEHTLKKFIHDFKKLIKYEEMKRRRRKLGHRPEETVLDSTDGRHDHTTTTTTQESSSYGEDYPPPGRDSVDRDSRYQQRNQTSPDRARPSLVKKTSRERGSTLSSPRRGPPSSANRSPIRQQKRMPPPEETGDTGSYDTDEDETFYENDETEEHTSVQRLPPLMKPPGREYIAQRTQQRVNNAPSKKQGNRLIMKRVTATKTATGDSLIEESDIDLGPLRRPFNHRVSKPSVERGRPHTAPTFKQKLAKQKQNSNQSIPASKRSSSAVQIPEEDEACDTPEPDELFHALEELIFPNDRMDSQNSLFDDCGKPKALLRPPPHVATDPVALYHWYKTYNWDIYSIPGEDRHMKLRWNVRAHTVGGYHPCVEVPAFYKPKKSCGC